MSEIATHLRSFAGALEGDVLPPHSPTCLGCGPDSPQGFHLQVRRDGDEVVVEHTFEQRHEGGFGVAHGGAVATLVDDLLGFLLFVARTPGVTRHLEVEYLKPVLVGGTYTVRGRIEERDGRKLWLTCTGTDAQGTTAFTGRGLFLAVPASHWSDAVAGGAPERVNP